MELNKGDYTPTSRIVSNSSFRSFSRFCSRIIEQFAYWYVLVNKQKIKFFKTSGTYSNTILTTLINFTHYINWHEVTAFICVPIIRSNFQLAFASSTQRDISQFSSLPIQSFKFNTIKKFNGNSHISPSYEWKRGRLGFWLFANDVWTGIMIIERYCAGLSMKPLKSFPINPSTFRVMFYPELFEGKGHHIVEVSTVGRAQKMGIAYYIEWLKYHTQKKIG